MILLKENLKLKKKQMKDFLIFCLDGTVIQLKTKIKIDPDKFLKDFNQEINQNLNETNKEKINNQLISFNNFEFFEYNQEVYILIKNDNNINSKENLAKIPFINNKIYGIFCLIKCDKNHNIKSFTEKKLYDIINKFNKFESKIDNEDYSSEDFD